jgi:acetyltransferase-like isoleucine patch superfamily enzyme
MLGLRSAAVAARDNAKRGLWLARMRREVHPERFASFGPDSVIVPPAVINCPHRIHIGNKVLIHERAWFSVYEHYEGHDYEPTLRIGDRVLLSRDTYISCVGQIEIGDDVFSGQGVLIADSYHDYRNPHTAIRYQQMAEPQPVRIGNGVILNPHVCVTLGVTIGDRSFIGAGAVVTRDIPPNSVAVGNPARVVRRFDHDRGEWVDIDGGAG